MVGRLDKDFKFSISLEPCWRDEGTNVPSYKYISQASKTRKGGKILVRYIYDKYLLLTYLVTIVIVG